ncbi:CWF19-like protein 1 [Dermacentor variabilis]|uniref:CWF19-like protein 1 n=1 Tax=Dermacentor variabilis TaxID=34621 RepID=UPI003F5BD2C5
MASPMKILVCGDVSGEFDKLFDRVSNVNKKNGPFDMLLCVGDFFGPDASRWLQYKLSGRKVPLQTYAVGVTPDSYSESDLADNVVHLGSRGIFTGASGLKIAYFCGNESKNDKPARGEFVKKEALEFLSPIAESTSHKGIDIFIASQWPKNVSKYAHTASAEEENGSDIISLLAYFLRPRYHFTSSGNYYERTPYRNHKILQEQARHVTRFISLASVGNAAKAKWLYAFSIAPMSVMPSAELVKQPIDVTECPYEFSESDLKDASKSQQFFYDLTPAAEKGKKRNRDAGGQQERKKRPPPAPKGPCWFCLASPEVEKHLVISIGESCYLALAKGALTPDHVLILPIGHHQSTVELDEETLEDVVKFKESLKQYFKTRGKRPVFFERNYKSSHLQIQVVPVPEPLMSGLQSVLVDYGMSLGVDLDEIPRNSSLRQIVDPGRPYFYMEFDNTKLLHRIKKNFPLQFGREVLACEEVLNLPDKADWKDCKMSRDEEVSMVAEFRRQFEPFDFTL